jgi:membrane associated rhomboid family serine protease
MAEAVAKVCVKCGEDVAGQRRVKDAQGRYFCGDCYDAMTAAAGTRHASGRPEAAPVAVAHARARMAGSGEARRPESSGAGLPAGSVRSAGPVCPCCHTELTTGATICVSCGIKVPSGRPMITAQAVDEDRLHANAEAIIKVIAWLIWLGFYPIASEAFATRKPIVIWAVAALTIVCSVWWAVAINRDPGNTQLQELMLWPVARQMSDGEILQLYRRHEHDKGGEALRVLADRVEANSADMTLEDRVVKAFRELGLDKPKHVFKWYQLFTNALLHDPDSIWGFAMHLGGNMLFLLIFGTRVNALVGNLKMLVLYPALAALASLAQLQLAHDRAPALGASGVIMGLAGMYLIFFPVHRVFMAFWLKITWRMPTFIKIWAMRGFWVLAFYLAFDVGATLLGSADGVAHWAHMGGFVAGVGLAVAMLVARLQDASHADLISVLLGRYAWPLIGKPVPVPRRVAAGSRISWR